MISLERKNKDHDNKEDVEMIEGDKTIKYDRRRGCFRNLHVEDTSNTDGRKNSIVSPHSVYDLFIIGIEKKSRKESGNASDSSHDRSNRRTEKHSDPHKNSTVDKDERVQQQP